MDSSVLLIRLRGIGFRYEPARPVLDGLDFDLSRGERVGVVGPNGSGKTTLFHLIVGLLRPTAGDIEVLGRIRREEKDFVEIRPKVGLVFQDPDDQLFCSTVEEDVAFGPLNLGLPRDEVSGRVHDVLQQLDLEDLRHRVTHRLSFGQKKLISIATVLAMEPEALLLDEPDGGLDDRHKAILAEVLVETEAATAVISHDMEFLGRVTQRSWRLAGGRITSP